MESSKRIKLSLSKKLKEYANKMGRDHLGGDDIPGNKKKGGLRDFDGYDNVQYNRDMPMDEDSPASSHPLGKKEVTQGVKVIEMLDVIAHWMFGPDYHKLTTKQKKEVHKEAIRGKIIKQTPFKESVNEGYSKHFTYDEVVKSIVDFAKSKGYKIPSKGLDIIKGNPPSGPIRGWSRGTSIPLDKKINLSFDIYGVGKVFTVNQRLKLNKTFAESVIDETTLFGDFLLEGGLPQNWMAGRTSDYHTKLRGKRKDYDDTNFAKMNTGQPDIEDEELDADNEVVNEKFDNTKHLSLLNKALRAIPGSKKQKDIIKQLNVVRKSGGMKPLKETAIEEYGQRLDLSYILDDESVLDGTPEEKDAINRESAKKKTEKNYKDWKSTNESFNDMVGDTYTFSIGSSDEKWIKPNTKEYVIEKIAETIKHNLYDWDFSLNGIDGSQAKEYSKIFDNDVLKPLLRNIDKTLKTYFKIDSKNKKISWKLSFRDNDKFIDTFFKKNKKISSSIRDSYFSQNESSKRDYKAEYKKFQSSTKSKKYRAELNKYNRDKGTYGNGDGKDASHKGGKIVGFEAQSKNRGRREKSRLKKK